MNILVIGGAGYIGAHVVHELVKDNHHIIVFDNLSSGFKENLPVNCNFIQGDILNKVELISALSQDIDAVFHFAAKKAAGESMIDVRSFSQTNIAGTINILDAMVECKVNDIIFSSSAAVYGEPEYIPIDESHPTVPTNYYGFTKLTIETLFQWYSKIHGINFASLRYFNAVGYDVDNRISTSEKSPQNLFPIIMEVLSGERESMNVYGDDYDTFDGTCIRDYIHVADLANAHILAYKKLKQDGVTASYNLGNGKGFSVKQVIHMVEKVTGLDVPFNIASRRVGDPPILIADSSKARKELLWSPLDSSLENIVESAWLWYNKMIGRNAKS